MFWLLMLLTYFYRYSMEYRVYNHGVDLVHPPHGRGITIDGSMCDPLPHVKGCVR